MSLGSHEIIILISGAAWGVYCYWLYPYHLVILTENGKDIIYRRSIYTSIKKMAYRRAYLFVIALFIIAYVVFPSWGTWSIAALAVMFITLNLIDLVKVHVMVVGKPFLD